MEIKTYRDLSTLSSNQIIEIAEKEREWFGREPFGEYLICTDLNCRRLLSIEEAYNIKQTEEVTLAELEKSNKRAIENCPCCSAALIEYCPTNKLAAYLREMFTDKSYGAFLLDERGKIQGESVTYTGRFMDVFDQINYRNGFTLEGFIQAVANNNHRLERDEVVVCSNRIAISRGLRVQGLYAKLLAANLNTRPENDHLAGVGDTTLSTRLFPLVIASGYTPLEVDHTGGVGLYTKNFGRFRETVNKPKELFKKDHGQDLERARLRQLELILKHQERLGDRFYRGTPLLAHLPLPPLSP